MTAASVVALLLALGIPSSRAATTGVGGSGGTTDVVQVSVGDDVLEVGVVGEMSRTSNDPATLAAVERVAPLTLASSLVPSLAAASLPALESTSTGPEDVVAAGPPLDLGAIATPIPALLDGQVRPGELRTAVDGDGAVASFGATADGVGILGGAVRVGTVALTTGSRAAGDRAVAERVLTADRVDILDVGGLLRLLGVDVADLPLGVVAGLADALGIELPGGATPTQFAAAVGTMIDAAQAEAAAITTQVAGLEATVAAHTATIESTTSQLPGLAAAVQAAESAATAQLPALQQQRDALGVQLAALVCAAVPAACDAVSAEIASVDSQIDALETAVTAATDALTAATTLLAQLNTLVDELQTTIQELLDDVAGVFAPVVAAVDALLAGLAGAPLVRVDDVEVRALADARATAASSTALATGSLGTVSVGAVEVPVTSAADAIDDVLGIVSPALTGVVGIEVLERSTSITAGSTTDAVAEITGLRLTLTPGDVCALQDAVAVSAVDGSLGDLLADIGAAAPPPPAIAAALGMLGAPAACGVIALAEPLTVGVLELRSDAAFTADPPGPTDPTDPTEPTAPPAAPPPTVPPPTAPPDAAPPTTNPTPPAPGAPPALRGPSVPVAAPQRPASSAPPVRMAQGPPLPRTGGSAGVGLVGLGLLAGAVALRRASRAAAGALD